LDQSVWLCRQSGIDWINQFAFAGKRLSMVNNPRAFAGKAKLIGSISLAFHGKGGAIGSISLALPAKRDRLDQTVCLCRQTFSVGQ
jgi:hypothetical protein